jgi:hypothetical protein
MRSLGLVAIICGLLPACAVLKSPVNASEEARLANTHPEDLPLNSVVVVEEERIEMPASTVSRETAATGDSIVEPSQRRSAATEPPAAGGRREMPGTARANAAPIFARSSVPLSKYKIEQSTDLSALEAKQRILDAMAETPNLPHDGAAITVITRGDKAILFGSMDSAEERKLVEDIAGENAKRVESHITIFQ